MSRRRPDRPPLAAFCLLVGLVGRPGVARADVIWRGDFETGDLAQWNRYVQIAPAPDDWSVVRSPLRQGQYAARVVLHPGDVGASGYTRAELEYRAPEADYAGSERYYGLSLRPSSTAPVQPGPHLVAYWEALTVYQIALAFVADGATLAFEATVPPPSGAPAGRLWTGSFAPDVWHDLVLHVRFSPDPAEGFVELFYDGQRVVARRNLPTMHRSGSVAHANLFHVGFSQLQAPTADQTMYVDGALVATALADVQALIPDGGARDAGAGDAAVDGALRDASSGDGAAVADARPAVDAAPAARDVATDGGTGGGSTGCTCRAQGTGGLAVRPALGLTSLVALAVARGRRRRRA